MEFIYADELKKTFNVFGHFYNLKLSDSVLKCRSVLEIKRKNKSNQIPDTIVVMMNPGSSTPLDKKYDPNIFSKEEYLNTKAKEIIPTKPDNAQYQIMRLMEVNKWDFVRILNLSDLRNGNSGKFQTEFRDAMKLDSSNPHCMTHIDRKKELFDYTKSKSNIIIAAWGNIAELKYSAEAILKLDKKTIGLKNGNPPSFRYASPYMKRQKIEWLTEIQKEIQKNQCYQNIKTIAEIVINMNIVVSIKLVVT